MFLVAVGIATVLKMLLRHRLAGLLVRISLLASGRTGASVITAKSVSLKDVTSAVSSAVDGDMVVIPGGTATWTSGLAINKAITLRGSGIWQYNY